MTALWLNVWRRPDGVLVPGGRFYETRCEAELAALQQTLTTAPHHGAYPIDTKATPDAHVQTHESDPR